MGDICVLLLGETSEALAERLSASGYSPLIGESGLQQASKGGCELVVLSAEWGARIQELRAHLGALPMLLDIVEDSVPARSQVLIEGGDDFWLSSVVPALIPDCRLVQVSPLAPHSLASRALVFSDQEPVTVFPATPERLMMVVDGSAGCYVWPEDRVLIRRSEHPVRFVRLADHEFFQVLRNKLGWGLPHVAKPGA